MLACAGPHPDLARHPDLRSSEYRQSRRNGPQLPKRYQRPAQLSGASPLAHPTDIAGWCPRLAEIHAFPLEGTGWDGSAASMSAGEPVPVEDRLKDQSGRNRITIRYSRQSGGCECRLVPGQFGVQGVP